MQTGPNKTPLTDLHPVVQRILTLLNNTAASYEYFEHEPVRTSEEAAKVRGNRYSLEQGAKALIVRIKARGGNKYFVMLVIPGDKKFDMEKTKMLFDAKDIRFATESEVSEITGGIKVGGVPPFGDLFGLEVYVDKGVLVQNTIVFNCGDKRASIALGINTYKNIVSYKKVDIT